MKRAAALSTRFFRAGHQRSISCRTSFHASTTASMNAFAYGSAGIRFDRIALGRRSLDDVFLSLIGRRMTNGDDTIPDGGV